MALPNSPAPIKPSESAHLFENSYANAKISLEPRTA
eukprot:CAMPEP_0169417432 /NCGR_PEP_ID=MMETSP1017-20121227/63723_1 /TAXON_ID=342587 /ORGANISM="Karlodinium micrum, Strain CCMP2283" /LENGTH=35 /DNA_ID= /DNA_START= /DNA_END= /DNA_ORIENTATION=